MESGDFAAKPPQSQPVWSTFQTVRFASGVYLLAVALATFTANMALLFSLKKNAIRLKAPTYLFFVGVGATDLLTGMLVEPALAVCHISGYETCRAEFDVLKILPGMVTTTAFLLVLLMSVSQYVAISHPHAFKRLVTKRRVVGSMAIAVAYSAAFSALKASGLVHPATMFAVEVCFHATFIPFLLGTFYVVVLVALRRHTRRRFSVLFRRSVVSISDSRLSIASVDIPLIGIVERHFIRMNLLLIVTLLVCTLPSVVVLHIILSQSRLHRMTLEHQLNLAIAEYISEDVLFLKFLLDPLIFAWSTRRL